MKNSLFKRIIVEKINFATKLIFSKPPIIKMVEFRRKLYKRGSSYETTIPMPILFALDKKKKYYVNFVYDEKKNSWYIKFEEVK